MCPTARRKAGVSFPSLRSQTSFFRLLITKMGRPAFAFEPVEFIICASASSDFMVLQNAVIIIF